MRANNGNSANGDSSNILTGIASYSAGGSVLIAVSFGDNGTIGSALMSAGVLSNGDGGLLSF